MPVRLAHAAGPETREVDSTLLVGQDRPDAGVSTLQAATVEVVGRGRLQVEQVRVVRIDRRKGSPPETARKVTEELTAHDALAAHLSAELNIDREDLVSPWRAALASAVAFTVGGIIPFAAMLLPPAPPVRIPATFIVVLLALAVTGALGARLGGSPMLRPTIRVAVGGAIALAATFLIRTLLGTTGVA